MTPPPHPDASPPPRAPASLVYPWLGLVCALLAAALAHSLISGMKTIADLFLVEQDLPALLIAALLLLAWRFTPLPAPSGWLGRVGKRRPGPTLAALALFAALVGVAGWFAVAGRYPLSMDEFMATFDARIFATGQPLASVPAEWQEFVPALQPFFRSIPQQHALWSSDYLPVSAAFRTLFTAVHAQGLLGAAWSGVAVIATFGVGRRLWPDRPGAALLAAGLVATSAQVLAAGMTDYAMPAHLALNMVWLWLFLRRDRPSQAAAALTAFAACGLHQVIFHPLFAAPFVLQAWLERRWGKAAFHTAAYALIGLFWMSYWGLALRMSGAELATTPAGGPADFIAKSLHLVEMFEPMKLGWMPKNLLRFVAWQNPISIVLCLAAVVPAWRAGGVWRSLILGVALLIFAACFLMPFQGHGWGYRYLHGFIGSVALLAAFGWIHLTRAGSGLDRRILTPGLAIGFTGAVVILLPLHVFQMSMLIRPYAAAYAAIARTDADVVLVDSAGLFYADDLVRNDPLLIARPKILDLAALTPEQVPRLCAGRKLALFDRGLGLAYGLRATMAVTRPDVTAVRAALKDPGCRVERVPGPVFTES